MKIWCYFFKFFICFFFLFWLCWVLVAVQASLWLWRAGATTRCGAWASHCGGLPREAWALGWEGFSSCSSWALENLWHTGFDVLWHVGSSQTGDQTRISCLGRRVLYHWATMEVPHAISWLIHFVMCNPLNMSSSIKWTHGNPISVDLRNHLKHTTIAHNN